MPICLRIVCGGFQMAELNSCDRDHLAPQSLEYLLPSPLYKMMTGLEERGTKYPCLLWFNNDLPPQLSDGTVKEEIKG